MDPNLYNYVRRMSHSVYLKQKLFEIIALADWEWNCNEKHILEVSCNELKFV